MKLIEPLTITDAILTASNVPETDYTAWSAVTAYVTGNRVILTTGYHKIYECIVGNTNKHPVTDPAAATYWLEVSATNRWKAFDQKIGEQVSQATSISYTFSPTQIVDRVALFGLEGGSVDILVKDSGAATIQDLTIDLVDRTEAVTWFTWLMDPIEYDTEALSVAIAGYIGNTVKVTINSTGTAKVGQIVLGRLQTLGETNVGTEVGFNDYSLIERDAFGNASIVPRAYTDTVTYQFSFPSENARLVKRVISRVRSVPSVYLSSDDGLQFATLVYGIHKGLRFPLGVGASFATLEVEGMS